MPALFLTEDDVRRLMDMPSSIEVVEEAFRQLAEAKAQNVPRRRAFAPGIVLHTMSASAEYLGQVGWKNYTTTKEGGRFHVAVYDNRTGEMLTLLQGDHLGRLRTGATSGVATEYMARPDAAVVGLFGTGKQARTQLQAVCAVRRIKRVDVYSRDADRRERFAAEMSGICNTDVAPVHSPDEAAAEKDIVVTATTARTPLFSGEVLGAGTHLNVIGSNSLKKAEVDVATVKLVDRIVCDSVEACRLEAGDFVEPLAQGVTDWALMHDLSDVVAGRETGRATAEEITLFKSVGLGIEDVAMAAEILKRARGAGLGRELPF